ncbi:MAG TPA: NAD-binding protein [Solirubrobacteraceae bacterium]|nr:NAD-binding protein [Solirubrobacteraceae bacterium]
MARLLIVGGGCRGRLLAAELVAEGHAVRIVTRSESRRAEIEARGAECVIGDPDRLGTLRPALEAITVACWLLATASGPRQQVEALHGARLEQFVHQLIDTTVRGLVYEAPSASSGATRAGSRNGVADSVVIEGRRIATALAEHNAIPLSVIAADPADRDGWLADARAAVASVLGVGPGQRGASLRTTV